MRFVGVDLGTSAVKAGLFDETGRLLRLARRGYPLYRPQPGWAEHEPLDWWRATCAVLQELLCGPVGGPITALGLSGQAPGHVLVTSDGTALGRAIGWSDRRATAEAAWLAEQITDEQALAWAGYAHVSAATQPPARLCWLRAHRIEEWRRCAAVVQPKDYVALQLTGRIATDCYSAFGLAHPDTGRVHPDYLAVLGIEPDKIPPALPPTAISGAVTSQAAAASGLPSGTPVIIGTIDAWCDIFGCGAVAPGRAVDVAGTSEVVAVVSDHPIQGEGVFSSPLLEGLHWVGGPMQMGGAAIEWLAKGLYGSETDLQKLEAEASSVAPGAEGLLFLPYLCGERAPHWDETARGAFVGLTDRHTRAHCARSVYEGVAFAVWDLLERSVAASRLHPPSLRVSGGGARSVFWNQIKADITGLPVQQMSVSDAACLGAAMLAAIGSGAFASLGDAAEAMTHPATVFPPRLEYAARYEALRSLWRGLYPALQCTFSKISQMEGTPSP